MSANEPAKPVAPRVAIMPRVHRPLVAVCLLAAGMALALAGNVYQFTRQRHFEHDVDLMQRNHDRQIAELKEAVSGVLEQNLLRYDELSKEIRAINTSTLKQAKSEVKRNSSELARALERRQRDVVAQISDLRADLRQDTASKLSKISNDLQTTHSDLKHVASELATMNGRVDSNAEEIRTELAAAHADPAPQEQQAAPPAPKKKQFWSKLHPFRSLKKKPEVSETDEE